MKTALSVAVLVLLAACASAADGPRRDSRVIGPEEIEESNQMSALDMIRTARPHWLRVRGTATLNNDPDIMVYIDGVRYGSPALLADVPLIQVYSMRFYDAREAQYRFGVGHLHGAIEVITRSG